jgi:hypothetical protein
MLELLKFFLQKIDFLAIAEMSRKHNNRKTAAQLHLILVQSYEIIELYQVLLDELQAALESYQKVGSREYFSLNPSRLASLLKRQASNLEVMEHLSYELMDELRILDNQFLEAYRSILPGKFGILFEAQNLLSQGRLPLGESQPKYFPATHEGEYRTLWFTWEKPTEDRKNVEKYLHGWSGEEKVVIDVNIHDGDIFFNELARYFDKEDPIKRLSEIKVLTESYRKVLQQSFSIEDVLSDIGKVRKHRSRAKNK